MKLLVKDNYVVIYAYNIEFGMYHEPFEIWKATNEDGSLVCYAIDNDYTLIENVEMPEDYSDGKYFYENGEFVLNEDWKPYVSTEDRLEIAENTIAELEESIVSSEQAITDLDLQDIETQQALTDMDIRLMALEG